MDLSIGAHTPNADPLHEARERDADLVQIFLSNPQGWKKPKPREDAEDLRRAPMPIYVHAPYLINLCADNNRVRIPSRRILQETCDAAGEIGAEAVVVHAGHVTGAGPTEDGLLRWRKALEALDTDMTVLIENTAGGDKALGRRVEWLARLWEEIGEFGPGFVLDTCHAWAGGEPLDGLVSRVLEATGRIDLLHLNDSRDGFDSRRDRHANLGRGEIPLDVMVGIVADAAAPVVVETPDLEGQTADIALIRSKLSEIDKGSGDDE